MTIGALVSSVGARPVETIQIFLDGFEEVTARNDSIGGFALLGPWVRVQINGQLAGVLERQVVTVFTLLSFFANTSLEIGAQRSLLVD